ncbi:MAG: ribonuclease PH [Victivallales bacterium]|jgi:ribonuclease PH|nr:ribonuclease PH [Victivallales bacterium]
MTRIDGRAPDELRKIIIHPNYLTHPLSSVLIECGDTRVICAVSIESKVPPWMKAQKLPGGWLTCEYGMLPASTHERMKRESSSGKQGGRTMEIQRLIGRSLRAAVDLNLLGENTVSIDCDVINADGGTRTASVTGAAVALNLACRCAASRDMFADYPIKENVAGISVGIVGGVPMLDLCYAEDSIAEVDMNVIMTESGKLVEVQGTAEGTPFSRRQLNELIDLAEHGLKQIFQKQNALADAVARGITSL